jgi:syringomycin synthetase protein SyrE
MDASDDVSLSPAAAGLDQPRAAAGTAADAAPRTGPLNGGAGLLPLALSQREIWLDQRAWPDSAHLNMGGAGFLRGPIDIGRVAKAVEHLADEFDALRMVLLPDGQQRLLPPGATSPAAHFIHVDLSADPAAATPAGARERMRAWCSEQMLMPFNVQDSPPWRLAFLHDGKDQWCLSVRFHHQIMDGWGSALVIKRWSEIYNGLAQGIVTPAPAPAYREFVEESQAYHQSEAFARDAAYWCKQIASMPAPLIERRHPAPEGQLAAARLVKQRMARAEFARLEQCAAQQGLTAFNYFLAALALYFAQVNHCREVVIGVPSLNRSGRQYRATPGMFVGVLAIKLDIEPGMTGAELLAATRTSMRGALRHARYPLSEVGRGVGMLRSGRDGLLDIFLSFERQDYAVNFGGVPLEDSRQVFSGLARHPLAVSVCDFNDEEDPEIVLEASAACFAAGEAELLGRRLLHLAQALEASPDAQVQTLPLAPAEEQWALLHGLHQDLPRHVAPPTALELFERQVALRPQATALSWDDGHADFASLNHRANLLAQRLVSLGAGPDRIVAMAVERGPALLLSMLATWKAGAAFLPLDADAPLERLNDILGQSEACVLLLSASLAERLAPLHKSSLTVRWNDFDLSTKASPVTWARPQGRDLAYVLFTSGSTGRPKGVMVEHATLARRFAWLSRAYGVSWQDCAAQATQNTFDPSLIELLLPLLHGGRVALPPAGRLLPESLAEFAVRHKVTIMAFVPSTLSRFLDAAGELPGLMLRVACCGGEVLPPALARRYIALTGGRLYNVYGPTEACIFATAWECTLADGDSALPIGRPIDDTRIYVLDGERRPLPMGVPGEIYIGGDTLARGYLNRPDLDRDAFLADPFVPGGRMYRTGDRGWLGVDGALHFTGRLDRQVKLRGYRIELGDIEAACMRVPGVTQAAARLVEVNGKAQIQAWVAATGAVTSHTVQSALRQRLPDYMVPSAIAVLGTLAESAVGKTDYAALPVQVHAPVSGAVREPATTLEKELVSIWESVLQHRPIGIGDNFFDIGGDSLAALSILDCIEARLGCKLPMFLLTEHPTIERLAVALGRRIAPPGMLVRLTAAHGRVPLYLAASGHGDVMRFQMLARLLEASFDVYMLQPPMDRPVQSVAELAELYVHCIRAQGREAGVVAGFSVGGIAALETARLLHQGGALRQLVLLDTIHPRSIVGGVASWRVLGWLVRTLRVQELSMNGRRLGALFNDPGLVSQVMGLRGYRPAPFEGPATLIRSSGLAQWDRLFFRLWRRSLSAALSELRVPGLHGSIFDAANVEHLAGALASVVADQRALQPTALAA